MANDSSVDWGFRSDVPHRHLEMWLRRKRPATFTLRVARRFLRFRDLLAATLCRAFSDGSPTWRPSSNWRCGQCPAAYLLVAFDQDAAKELQHLLPAVSTNCCPPFAQIVRDRAGGCLTISGAAFCNILMASFCAACSETRLHACRHVHKCKEPLKTTDQQWRAQCSRLPKEAFPTKEDHHLLKEGQPPAWR